LLVTEQNNITLVINKTLESIFLNVELISRTFSCFYWNKERRKKGNSECWSFTMYFVSSLLRNYAMGKKSNVHEWV